MHVRLFLGDVEYGFSLQYNRKAKYYQKDPSLANNEKSHSQKAYRNLRIINIYEDNVNIKFIDNNKQKNI